jgi:hypothetical protein
METDVDPLARPAAPDEALRRYLAGIAAHFARSAWSDTYDIAFVRELPRGSERVVFHERVHYWQQVSTPALQLKFMSHLDKLSYGVSALGGRGDGCAARCPTPLWTPRRGGPTPLRRSAWRTPTRRPTGTSGPST